MVELEKIAPAYAKFAQASGSTFLSIEKAIRDTQQRRELISDALSANQNLVSSTETSMVVFGSLARSEVTAGSDIDWTLLIDGPADPQHRAAAHEIETRLVNAGHKRPGPSGIFGKTAYSHNIIHQIGGDEDSNRNTTQRILLLLESEPIGNCAAYDRVLKGIITRYFADDLVFATGKMRKQRVPRFLLNDIIRYWRTVAVDYASKKYERNNRGWALRNIKLRMSRKLTFCAGLLACFNCELDNSVQLDLSKFGSEAFIFPLVNRMKEFVRRPPLETLVDSMQKYKVKPEVIAKGLAAYDRFLSLLSDTDTRDALDKLEISHSQSDEVFNRARDLSYDFQNVLDTLFFDSDDVGPLTRKYGVF